MGMKESELMVSGCKSGENGRLCILRVITKKRLMMR